MGSTGQFLPTPSVRRATSGGRCIHGVLPISTHALREEGDGRTHDRTRRHRISTHALREEGDANSLRFSLNAFIFLPTPSVRRATPLTRRSNGSADIFLPTPSARRATCWRSRISCTTSNFYPRPPRGGRRVSENREDIEAKFLPTPSARRATRSILSRSTSTEFLPTPSARRATAVGAQTLLSMVISTHALREEGDTPDGWTATTLPNFYPRPPRGGRP